MEALIEQHAVMHGRELWLRFGETGSGSRSLRLAAAIIEAVEPRQLGVVAGRLFQLLPQHRWRGRGR